MRDREGERERGKTSGSKPGERELRAVVTIGREVTICLHCKDERTCDLVVQDQGATCTNGATPRPACLSPSSSQNAGLAVCSPPPDTSSRTYTTITPTNHRLSPRFAFLFAFPLARIRVFILGGDQGLLNQYFSTWKRGTRGVGRLPFTDNMTANAR